MAIEAVNQLNVKDPTVSGFDMKSVVFQKSLVIPEEGIETRLTLRSLRDRLNVISPWREFILYSFEAGDWVQNCRGYIKVDHGTPKNRMGPDLSQSANSEQEAAFAKAVSECRHSVPSGKFYTLLKNCGIDYGPSFQRLGNISCGTHQDAIAEVKFFEEPQGPYKQWAVPHVVHPTTLDAIAHSMYIGLTDGAAHTIPTSIPTKVQRIWVSRRGLNYLDAGSAHLRLEARRIGPRAMESSIVARSKGTAKTLISMENLETVAVAELNSPALPPEREEKFYLNLEYKPDINLSDNGRLKEHCMAGASTSEPLNFFRELKRFMIVNMSRSLADFAGSGQKASAPHLQKYVAWMEMHLENVSSEPMHDCESLKNDPSALEQLGEYLSSYSTRGRLVVEVGHHLSSILRGTMDVHQLLFGRGLVHDFYKDIFLKSQLGQNLLRYIDLLAHRDPGMNIIEIGGGTGGATDVVVNALSQEGEAHCAPRFGKYDFTDISHYFLNAAAEKFQHLSSYMNFYTFSIDAEPEDQGVELGTYDVVLAFAVLHLADNLSTAIQRLRKMLKPYV